MELTKKSKWIAVRDTALECIKQTWELRCWSDFARNGDDEYDTFWAGEHLAAIERARATHDRALSTITRKDRDSILLAAVNEGSALPDFNYRYVCGTTAHAAAIDNLGVSLLHLETGFRRLEIDFLDDLKTVSEEQLRDTLISLIKKNIPIQDVITEHEFIHIRTWVRREWAAVVCWQSPDTVASEDDSPNAIAESSTGSVRLFGRNESPIVKGSEKATLTKAQYDVVLALLEAGDRGLTKDELDGRSKHGDSRGVLRRLAKSNPEWESVISFAGTPGKGYRIV